MTDGNRDLERTKEAIRSRWTDFGRLHDELLELALEQPGIDEGDLAQLLGRMIGHIQYCGLDFRSDPARPTLHNVQYGPWNWGFSNPDTLYLGAGLSDRFGYRVYGTLGTASQTTFGVYAGYSDQSVAVKVLADELELEDCGSFEIFFTKERQGRNWFQPPEGMSSFACYQTFNDWEHETKGTVRIERVDLVDAVGPGSVRDSLSGFDTMLERSRDMFTMWTRDIPGRMLEPLPANVPISPLQPPSAMAGAWFSPMKWRLEQGDALVIDYQVPEGSPYVGICLNNRWGEMIDVDSRQTSLSLGQSIADDGHVRLLLSNQDVGVSNWLDARGQTTGFATWRASHPEAPEAPQVTVIRLDEFGDYFAASEHVTPDERAEAMRDRQRHFAYRNGA